MKRRLLKKRGKAAVRCHVRKAVSCLTVLALLFGTGQAVMGAVEASENGNTSTEYLYDQSKSADDRYEENSSQTEMKQNEETVTENVTEKFSENMEEIAKETEKSTENVTETSNETEMLTEKTSETIVETERMTEANTETELSNETAIETEDMTEMKSESEAEPECETEASRELLWEGEDYTIKVEYDFNAGLPEDVTLEVTEIAQDSDEYQTYLEASAEAVCTDKQNQQITFARFFDVQFIKDGEKLEPKAPVIVTITYAQAVEIEDTRTCQTVHFTDTGIEVLKVSAEQLQDGSTGFTHKQISFSVLGTVVTNTDTGLAVNDGGGSRTITFMVRENGELTTVATASSYLIDANGNPYITSETAKQYFGDYGYDPAAELDAKFEYSYNDIYTIFYAQGDVPTIYCMDVASGNMEENNTIWIYSSQTANDADARAFRIWEPESGYCCLTPIKDSSYYISLKDKKTENGTKLILSKESGDASRWRKVVNSNGTVSFGSKLEPTKYIDLENNCQNNNTVLQIYGDAANRYWKLVQEYRFSNAVLSFKTDNQYTIGSKLESNGDIVCVYNIPDTSKIYTPAGLKKLANGGTYELGKDIVLTGIQGDAAAELTGSVNTTLDLNGNTILYNPSVTENDKLIFKLSGTSSLTLKDSGRETEKVEIVSDTLYGNLADYDATAKILSYYVTESAENGTGTTETLKKHTVDLSKVGALESTSLSTEELILAEENSSLTIEGGRYTNPKGLRAITVKTSGNVMISGGYICGNIYSENNYVGGGIYIEGSGDLKISDGVIAANKASRAGGVYKGGSGSFIMTGGVISGNEVLERSTNGFGGGVESDVDTDISGGYITNNRNEFYCENIGYGDHYGGGIACFTGSMTISGGYITGNYSREAGGGVGFNGNQFCMTGGTVAANMAQLAEGGGIRIQNGEKTSLITGGYITNNSTNTTHDWGGGGIFLTKANSLQIMDAVFTNNEADGFGGGIGGCSTGQIIAVDNSYGGIAVYENRAKGEVMAGSDGVASSKPDDLTAKNNETFMKSGYQDLFCALNSAVTGNMLGGGDQNWTGSCDYQPVTIHKDDVKIASQMMGLTANPSKADIQNAVNRAGVYISGNHSGTHGGGIMSNGTLILGKASEVELVPGLKISGSKLFKDTDGDILGTAQGQFTFQLLDDDRTTVLKTASNAANGSFYIEPDIPKKEGTYTYYLKELSRETAGMNYDITYDSTMYELKVTVTKKKTERNLSQENIFTINSYVVTKVTVGIEGSDEIPSVITNEFFGSEDHRTEVTIKRSEIEPTFVNTISEKPLYFRINKVDSSTQKPMSFVKFTLKDDQGNLIEGSTTFEGIVIFPIKKGKNYTLTEKNPDGYYKAGPWILKVDENGNVKIWNTTADANGILSETGDGNLCTGISEDGVTYYDYKIENTPGYSLPNTGGIGTTAFSITGTIFVLTVMVLFFERRRMSKANR